MNFLIIIKFEIIIQLFHRKFEMLKEFIGHQKNWRPHTPGLLMNLVNVGESDNDVTKLKCTINTKINKMKMLKKLGSYTDAVKGCMLIQSEST